jgi:hypothetical protein
VVVALAPVGETRTMTRAARRHRSWHDARRAQRWHLRQAPPVGAVDCVCERSVWFFTRVLAWYVVGLSLEIIMGFGLLLW